MNTLIADQPAAPNPSGASLLHSSVSGAGSVSRIIRRSLDRIIGPACLRALGRIMRSAMQQGIQ